MCLSTEEIKIILTKLAPSLNEKNVKKVIEITNYHYKEDKEKIVKRNQRGQQVFFILKGAARGYIINEKGIEKNIFLRTAGFFGGDINNMFYGKPKKYTFESMGRSHFLICDFNKIESLSKADHNFMQWYLNSLKEIISLLNYRIETFVAMTAKERYLDLIKRNPKFLEKSHFKHIANFLGITAVSFSRIIKEIKETNNEEL